MVSAYLKIYIVFTHFFVGFEVIRCSNDEMKQGKLYRRCSMGHKHCITNTGNQSDGLDGS